MSDLDIIRKLEQELGVELPLLTDDDKSERGLYKESGYILNENKKIIGLRLFSLNFYKISKNILTLKSLQELNLSGNWLSTLPESITNLKSLKKLYLSFNKITHLPESIGNLKNLLHFDLSFNKITQLPESIGNLKNLQKLDLRGNQLSNLPESFGNLKYLQKLNLTNNQLSNLPKSTENMKSLQKLDLSGNWLSTLPESITKLKNLQDLNLDENQISTLPESINNLKSLQDLNLGGNQFLTLPKSVTNLKSLKDLNLGANRLSTLPESINNLKSLQKLDLGANRLSTLPESINTLKSLQDLNLRGNQFSNLPESIGNLTSLQILDLGSNQLSTLPESIGNLTSLQELYLGSNQLSTLPEAITNLKSLHELGLDSNQLSTLPESIGNLKSLQILYLGGNRLSTLPESITNLKSLQNLKLSYNQFSALPKSITNLKSLQELYLSDNQISEKKVIKQLLSISSLKKLTLFGNSIEDIPQELLGAGVYSDCLTEIKDFFLSKERGTGNDFECKVIVIGNGGVGKSSLIRRMVENKFDENEESTHAIRLRRWPLSYNPGSECYNANNEIPEGFIPLRLNIWDFGGQDLYHATHQLFMRTKALFLLVWDLKHEEESKTTDAHDYTSINHPVQYWLDYCHTLGEGSPVIIVQNRFDKDISDYFDGYDELNREYNIIRKDFHLNVKKMENSESNFEEFITNLAKVTYEMTKEHSELPNDWITLRERIYRIRENKPDKKSLTMNEYLDLCDETGVTAIESKTVTNTVLEYFHNTGVLFYNEDLFEGQIIIDQQWAIEAVYTLFDRKKNYYFDLRGRNGAFKLSDLGRIDGEWKERSLDEQKLLISYMESCELIFAYRKIEDYNGKEEWEYISPQLLPDREEIPNEIKKVWRKNDSKRAIYLRYQYEMLHCAVIYRLIARLGRLSPNNATMWNRGLIIHDEKSDGLILIEAKPERNSVEIAISAEDDNSRRELIGQIESEFEALHNHQKSKREVSPNGVDFVELDTLKMKAREGADKLDSIEKKTCDVADFHIFIGLKRLEEESSRRLSKSSKEHREKEKKMISREIKGFIIDKFAGNSSDFDDLRREMDLGNIFEGDFDTKVTSLINRIEQNIPNYKKRLYDALCELKKQHKEEINQLFSIYPDIVMIASKTHKESKEKEETKTASKVINGDVIQGDKIIYNINLSPKEQYQLAEALDKLLPEKQEEVKRLFKNAQSLEKVDPELAEDNKRELKKSLLDNIAPEVIPVLQNLTASAIFTIMLEVLQKA